MPFIPVPRRQRQMDLSGFKASLVYTVKPNFISFSHFYLYVYTPPSVRAGVHRDQSCPIPLKLELQVLVSPLT